MQDILNFLHQHLGLAIAGMAVLILLIILEFMKIKQGAKRVSPQQVVQLINHEKAVIIDIRSKELFAKGHILGSISLPFSELTQTNIEKYRTQPIILVCASGLESPKAAIALHKFNVSNIQILEGGLRNWQQANLPLVKD